MKRLAYILLLVLAVAVAGVIGWPWFLRRIECPTVSRPENRGWRESREGDAKYLGSFVLDKGAATDNGQIGVQVVDIKAGQCPQTDYETEGASSASLRFFRPSDQKTLCKTNFRASSSTSYDALQICGNDFPFNRIRIHVVDAGDGWVSFSLLNYEGK